MIEIWNWSVHPLLLFLATIATYALVRVGFALIMRCIWELEEIEYSFKAYLGQIRKGN